MEKEFAIEWPLIEAEDPDKRLFPELSDEDLTELEHKSQEQFQEPKDEAENEHYKI